MKNRQIQLNNEEKKKKKKKKKKNRLQSDMAALTQKDGNSVTQI